METTPMSSSINADSELESAPFLKNPTPLEDMLFLGTYGYVIAMDVSAGGLKPPKELWRTNLVGTGYAPVSLVYEMPKSLFAATACAVFKLDCFTGEILWRTKISGDDASLWFTGDKLLVGHAGYLSCLNPFDGSLIWSNNMKNTGLNPVSILVLDNCVYAGTNGFAYCYDLNSGVELWRDDLHRRGFGAVTMTFGSSSQGRPTIYIAVNSSITAFDATTRKEVATCTFGGALSTPVVSLALHQGDVWAANDSQLFKFDGHTLAQHYKDPLSGTGYGAAGALLLLNMSAGPHPTILLEAHNGYVSCVDVASGQILWKTNLADVEHLVTMLEHKGVVYLGCRGYIAAIDPLTGNLLFKERLKGMGYSQNILTTIYRTTNTHSDQPAIADYQFTGTQFW